MKSNRNDVCPCGSGKKYKNCCDQKRFLPDKEHRMMRWLISSAVGLFLAVLVWGVVEYFITDHPEMEAYKCDNPNCSLIHYRAKTNSN